MDFDAQGNPIKIREVKKSDAYLEFLSTLAEPVSRKVKRAVQILECEPVPNQKVIKNLTGTIFHELRISVDNEYRVILFAVDHSNIVEARKAILLNGFVKKSTKDYPKEVKKAERILNDILQ